MKRSFLLLLLALFASTGLTACNTVKGFGKDLQKVGEQMEEKADK
ncbi:entericidin A/B family lipoprotein [Aerolutibacter ruishenii]|uniref:Putative small secreted protein n=1 Tax=Aerolutibacter ruishenii TaxID=686800 RepID=A0A562M308_9GAMM|nr:entericidin A/B family lipoprotein [Lysobacter ruishenii]TWI14335.1 putative small secreted protein [Lysobacter ruishenii]